MKILGLSAYHADASAVAIDSGRLVAAVEEERFRRIKRRLGERVKAGVVIAELVDPMADDPTQARRPIVTRADGLLFTRRRTGQGIRSGRSGGAWGSWAARSRPSR